MKKLLKSLLSLLLVLVVVGGYLFWEVTRKTQIPPVETDGAENPWITPVGTTMLSGHRSGGGIAPENTLMALKNCVKSKDYQLDIFEFDIRLTADGVPVLIHDEVLDRTSDAAEIFGEEGVTVGSKTLKELKKLNMGAKFENDAGEMPYAGLTGKDLPKDLQIVTLKSALTYLEKNGKPCYIIEIKNSGETGYQAADLLYEMLKEFDALDRAVIGTFHNEVTEYVDTTYPDMLRSAGFDECIEFYLYSLVGLEKKDGWPFVALQVPTTDYTVNLGTSRLVNYAHRNNVAVQYWTINDPEEMTYLQSIGADAIMTDVPDKGAEVLHQPE